MEIPPLTPGTDLRARWRALWTAAATAPDDGRLLIELALADKLLGRSEDARTLLERALTVLDPRDRRSRQRAQFLLGLTWGDLRVPRRAVDCFEAAASEDPNTRPAQAARAYAHTYREHFGLGAA